MFGVEIKMSNDLSFDFDTPVERRGTCSMKWEKYVARDIIPLNFGCPRVILEKALNRMASALVENL